VEGVAYSVLVRKSRSLTIWCIATFQCACRVSSEEAKVSTILLDYSTVFTRPSGTWLNWATPRLPFSPGHTSCTRHHPRKRLSLAMQASGVAIEPSWVIECGHHAQGRLAEARKVAESLHSPTAILCSNDVTAIVCCEPPS